MWVFAIHGDNAEIIQYLEEKQSEDDMKNEKKYDKLHPHKKHFKQKKDRSIELTKNFNIFSFVLSNQLNVIIMKWQIISNAK